MTNETDDNDFLTDDAPGLPAYDEVAHQNQTQDPPVINEVTQYPKDEKRQYQEHSKSHSLTRNSLETRYQDEPTGSSKPTSSLQSLGSGLPVNDTSVFRTLNSSSSAIKSLTSLLSDVIQNPTVATVDIFKNVIETCKKGSLRLSDVLPTIDQHKSIFWFVVRKSQMPDMLDILLENSTNALIRPTIPEFIEALDACLIHDDNDSYRKLLIAYHTYYTKSNTKFLKNDEIRIMKTEAPNLGFIALIKFTEFSTRWRVTANPDIVAIFPARHRLWTIHIGYDKMFYHGTQKACRIECEKGDFISSVARIRLRHPAASEESEWLDLGNFKPWNDPVKGALMRAGPVDINRLKDWASLEFGDSSFLGENGDLEVQVDVRARSASTGGDCVIS